jgi:hypothetical protein
MTPDPQPSREYLAAMPPPEKRRTSVTVLQGRTVVVAVVLAIVIMFAVVTIVYYAPNNNPGGCCPAAVEISFIQGENGSRNSNVPTTWGLTAPFPCTACATDNFTLYAPSGLTTDRFGLKIGNTSVNPTSTAWVAILWNYSGHTPLAGYSSSTGAWTAATGQTLPIGGLQDDGLMLVSTVSLTGQHNILFVIGTGGLPAVGGQVTL